MVIIVPYMISVIFMVIGALTHNSEEYKNVNDFCWIATIVGIIVTLINYFGMRMA